MRGPGPFGAPGAGRDRMVDAAVVVGLVLFYVLEVLTSHRPVPGQRPDDALGAVLIVLMAGPYVTHRRWPLGSAAVSLAALVVYSLAHYLSYPGVSAFVLLFGIALHSGLSRSLPTFVATMLGLTFAVVTQPDGVVTTSTWISTLLFAAVAGLTGRNMRYRRARWAALEERARLLENEREDRSRRAVEQERLRIARELHDVVAHSMSVIAVQSGVGNHVLDTQPQVAREALAAIETTSRTALAEMRRLLGVLRSEDEPSGSLSPAPGLADLPELLQQVRQAGLNVSATVSGVPASTAVPVDLTAYRIVQEALTNVIKHGGDVARVNIAYATDSLDLEITDNGPLRHTATRGHGTGHGLIGMQERVAVFGGRLWAAERPGGGFRVAAQLPVTEDRR